MVALHVVSLPHTQVTRDYAACAYTQKVRRFIPMMQKQGYEVVLHQPVTAEEQALFGFHGPADYLNLDFNSTNPLFVMSNARAIAAILTTAAPEDLVLLIGGDPQQAIVDNVPNLCVEFGVGYKGVCKNTQKVFESHAWRNFIYGRFDMDGQFYDEVIPNYYDIDEFPVVTEPDDYFAFVGRLTPKKGYSIACDVAKRLGKRLVVVGPQASPDDQIEYGEYLGMLPIEETIKVMAHASALFVPTFYVGPFEGVHIEAQLCGTPVITTDFGVFSETVENDVNGFRCTMFRDFMEAVPRVEYLNRRLIAHDARLRYSTKTVGTQYADYFERLSTRFNAGFYAE